MTPIPLLLILINFFPFWMCQDVHGTQTSHGKEKFLAPFITSEGKVDKGNMQNFDKEDL